ncbi:unnamed protein product, partial [Arabidopsis halleri]
MESPAAHLGSGIGFLTVGVWHLFNNIRLFCLNPNIYSSSPWFPSRKLRYLELYFIMVSLSIITVRQLFIGPKRHNPFDPDGTIPSSHLRSVEHAILFMSFIVYAVFAIVFDGARPRAAATAKAM